MTVTALVFEKRHAQACGLAQAQAAIANSYLFVLAHAVRVPGSGPTDLRKAELDIVLSQGSVFSHHDARLGGSARVREELARAEHPLDAGRGAAPAPRARGGRRAARDGCLRRRGGEAGVGLAAPHSPARHGGPGHGAARRLAPVPPDRRPPARGAAAACARRIRADSPRAVALPPRRARYHAVRIADLIEDARDLLGYPAALAAMALTAGSLLMWFKRRGWLA
jgi:hypothetical protein